jgi:hypothetical protein
MGVLANDKVIYPITTERRSDFAFRNSLERPAVPFWLEVALPCRRPTLVARAAR